MIRVQNECRMFWISIISYIGWHRLTFDLVLFRVYMTYLLAWLLVVVFYCLVLSCYPYLFLKNEIRFKGLREAGPQVILIARKEVKKSKFLVGKPTMHVVSLSIDHRSRSSSCNRSSGDREFMLQLVKLV